jgi:hypothetical protein
MVQSKGLRYIADWPGTLPAIKEDLEMITFFEPSKNLLVFYNTESCWTSHYFFFKGSTRLLEGGQPHIKLSLIKWSLNKKNRV